MEVGSSISNERVIRVLDRLREEERIPKKIRVDNGAEFISGKFQLKSSKVKKPCFAISSEAGRSGEYRSRTDDLYTASVAL